MILEMTSVALISVLVFMFFLWLIHLAIKNVGIIDFGWVMSIVIAAFTYFMLGEGYGFRKLMVFVMVSMWGLRLAFYILVARVIGKSEDPRYQEFRKAGGWINWGNFFLLFEFQALIAFVFSFAFLFPCLNQHPRISILEFVAFFLLLIAVSGEALADYQLSRFKSDRLSKGKVCQVGLWKYSRHPNYFFEWLTWISFFLFSLASPFGFISVVAPLLILYFLFKVTGIPATEAQALRSKGEAYREYQKRTSVFIPWFPKRS